MKIGIGIDTGGTYTDAVIYNFQTKEILGSAKALTTKDDLSLGIGNALDGLPKEVITQAEIIALSTTLATNACVENKGGRAKLIFIGVDKKVVAKVGKNYGLPKVDEIFFLECDSEFKGNIVTYPDWNKLEEYCNELACDADSVGIVEIHAMNNNAVLEKKAKQIISEKLNIEVICGYELFSDLNSIQRGSSALLNARLIPIIEEFLKAIKLALKARNIDVPVVIVRSDGTLMSDDFTSGRPVETLLCGPAASVMGGLELTGEKNSLIVDMGGTTTDIAIIKNGIPLKSKDGINVGKWKTFVKGLYIDTFGLGGDSSIRYKDNKLILGSNRIVPLSIVASKYPKVIEGLRQLVYSNKKHTYYLHEFYMLVKDIENNPNYTTKEKAFCRILAEGPLGLMDAASALNEDVYTMDMKRLEKEGVVVRCGLTPTDIMHIKGDFKLYNKEAALLGAEFVARCLSISVEALCKWVYNEVEKKLYINIVRILLEDRNPSYRINGLGVNLELFIEESYKIAKETKKGAKSTGFLNSFFQTPASLIGIGAPIHVFLPEVAELLGTKCIIPQYAGVANALGAVVGNISASFTIEIKPQYFAGGINGYTVYGKDKNTVFDDLEQAIETAKEEAERAARQEAINRGACGNVNISTELITNDAEAKDCTIYLGTLVVSTAYGRLSM